MRQLARSISLLAANLAAAGCAFAPASSPPPQVLRLATTTSTADSGLLDSLLPDFERQHNARVDVVAVGTGQALALGANGDTDVVLVHARAREDQFVADGHGTARIDVMGNDFIVVGPPGDPAGVRGLPTAAAAFTRIAAAGALFASRGDDSGTHTREMSLWAAAGLTPTAEARWYLALGQGMGETLIVANETGAYTLTDRGTWLAQKKSLPDLTVMVGGATITENRDAALLNPYGVIPVNPRTHPGVNYELALLFVDWLTAPGTQTRIAEFGLAEFGQPLFYPGARP